jgi:hypothetical protein
MQTILSAISEQTAFTIPRFPFNYGEFCTIQYWVESKDSYGQRLVSRMWNPVKQCWGKNKNDSYHDLVILQQFEEADDYYRAGLPNIVRLSLDQSTTELQKLFNTWAPHLTEWQLTRLTKAMVEKKSEEEYYKHMVSFVPERTA